MVVPAWLLIVAFIFGTLFGAVLALVIASKRNDPDDYSGEE